MELFRDNVKVEWEFIGEGLCGDYQPDNPDDVALLRFYVSVLRDGSWVEKEDASYCTQFPVSASEDEKLAGLNLLLNKFYDALHDDIDVSVKKLGEQLSWISPDVVHQKPYRVVVKEVLQREVEVFADDLWDAIEKVEELCNNGTINLDAEDFTDRSTECLGLAEECHLSQHQVFDQYGVPVKVGKSNLDSMIAKASAKQAEVFHTEQNSKETVR